MNLFQIGGWDSPVPLKDLVSVCVFLLAWRLWGRAARIEAGRTADVHPALLHRTIRAAGMSLLLAFYLLRYESGLRAAGVAIVLFAFIFLIDVFRFSIARGSAASRKRVAIVGSGRLAMLAWRALRTECVPGKSFAGFIDIGDSAERAPDIADRYLGGVETLPRLLLEKEIDELIVAVPIRAGVDFLEEILRTAGALGVRVQCVKDIFGAPQPIVSDEWEDIFLELLPAPRIRGFGRSIKRALDIAFSALCLAAGSPILLMAAIRRPIRGAGSAFRRELVYGFGRRRFQMLTFSSVSSSAPHARWIDRIPQMWNVLRGEMSLVGPRPLATSEALQMHISELSGRFSVRPGVTVDARDWAADNGLESVRTASWPASTPSSVQDWSLAADLKALFAAWRADYRRENAGAS